MKYLDLHIQVFHANLILSKKEKTALVAQWTRARGYEPRCQGFESLLARNNKLI